MVVLRSEQTIAVKPQDIMNFVAVLVQIRLSSLLHHPLNLLHSLSLFSHRHRLHSNKNDSFTSNRKYYVTKRNKHEFKI